MPRWRRWLFRCGPPWRSWHRRRVRRRQPTRPPPTRHLPTRHPPARHPHPAGRRRTAIGRRHRRRGMRRGHLIREGGTTGIGSAATGAGTDIAGYGRPGIGGAEPSRLIGLAAGSANGRWNLGMLYFANWKILLICAICALGVLLSAPNLVSPSLLDGLPSFVPHRQVALGLDLRGGSYLLLEVDVAAAQRDRLNSLVDNVRNALLDANIGYTGLAVQNDAIVFKIRQPERIEDARLALAKIDPDLTVTIAPDGSGTVGFSAVATDTRRRQAVDQSIEIIRRRIDETGIKEPTIEREAEDRILVQLPGVDDPEHVKDAVGPHRKADLPAGRHRRVARRSARRPSAAGRRDFAGGREQCRARGTQRLCRAQAGDGRRRHAGRCSADLSEQRAGRQLPLRRRGCAAIWRCDARECRQAVCDRARQQGHRSADHPRGDPWRLGHHFGQLYRAVGERSGPAAARRGLAGADHDPRGAHRRPRSRRRIRSAPVPPPASSGWRSSSCL